MQPWFSNITVKVVKKIINYLATECTDIYNRHLNEGSYPDILKQTKFIPLYKKRDFWTLQALQPIIGKLFERIIKKEYCNF